MRASGIVRLLLAALTVCPACEKRCCVPESLAVGRLLDVCPPPCPHAVVGGETLRELADESRRRAATHHPAGSRPYNVLVLSGGGFQGAFGAGLLKGWTDSGTRPRLDVVSGVSTGAILATFAFLGPQYDDDLRRRMVGVVKDDILKKRGPLALFFRDALNSSERLEERINDGLTPEVIAEVAQAHAAGRRLYVGTSNLDTGRLVIWDMGEIASRGTPEAIELYRKVVLASSAIPGAMPPVRLEVEINGQCYEEQHVDGAASGEVIYRPFMVADLNRIATGCVGVNPWAPAGSRLFVVNNGKLYADPKCARPRVIGILGDSSGTLLYNKSRDEMYRVYLHCLQTGVAYRSAEVPAEVEVTRGALKVTPEDQERLYEVGYGYGKKADSGEGWRDLPPDVEPHEQTLPRSGTKFRSEGCRSAGGK